MSDIEYLKETFDKEDPSVFSGYEIIKKYGWSGYSEYYEQILLKKDELYYIAEHGYCVTVDDNTNYFQPDEISEEEAFQTIETWKNKEREEEIEDIRQAIYESVERDICASKSINIEKDEYYLIDSRVILKDGESFQEKIIEKYNYIYLLEYNSNISRKNSHSLKVTNLSEENALEIMEKWNFDKLKTKKTLSPNI